jgi:putative peptidoglycan lipid II flippase
MKFIRSFSLLMIITILTQILMMLRNIYMANNFGVSQKMDSYNIANVLTVSTVSVISAAITTVLIPLLSKKRNLKEEKESINTFVSVLGILSIIFVILFILFGRPLVSLIMPNLPKNMHIVTFDLILILSISQVFKVVTGISTAFLQTSFDFVSPKIATFFAAIVSISYFLFSSSPSIFGVTIVLGLSFIIETLYVLLMQKKINFKYSLTFKIKNPTFIMLCKSTGPILLSSAAFQLSIIFSNFIASYLGEGYVSIFGYANQLVNIIYSLFILNIVMMLYPSIAQKFESDLGEAKKSLVQYINLTNLFIIPIVFGYLVLGDLIIEILFQRGSFTANNTHQVYLISGILFISFPFNTMRDYVYRCFYSIKDTRTPSRNSILIVLINIILIIGLLPFFKVYAVALGPVFASIISLLLSYKKLKKKIGELDTSNEILKRHIWFTINATIMGAVVFIIKSLLLHSHVIPLIKLILLVMIGGFIYLVLTFLTQKSFIRNSIRRLS